MLIWIIGSIVHGFLSPSPGLQNLPTGIFIEKIKIEKDDTVTWMHWMLTNNINFDNSINIDKWRFLVILLSERRGCFQGRKSYVLWQCLM